MSYLRALRLTCLATLVGIAGCSDSQDAGSADDEDLTSRALKDAAKLPSLDDVCPASRTDALCAALHAGDKKSGADARAEYDKARTIVAQRVADEDTQSVLGDAAVRYYVRERAHANFVHEALKAQDPKLAESNDYWKKADGVTKSHFPLYELGKSFLMARVWDPPADAAQCDKPTAALLVFPDVARILARNEFASQMAALGAARPCLKTVLVDTGSFVVPATNAKKAKDAVVALDRTIPLHFLGYGQGARNALEFLVDSPESAPRVRSVVTINSAAHGSELADDFAIIVNAIAVNDDPCARLTSGLKPLCEKAMSAKTGGVETVLGLIAPFLGTTGKEIEAFVKAEDGVQATPTLSAFFKAHLEGMKSLTTADAKDFFARAKLPAGAAYMSFRTAITSSDNVPKDTKDFYELLKLTSAGSPGNDMFVRLGNESLGAKLNEIQMPVAEGNHWQWAMSTGDLPDALLPHAMTDDVPREALLVGYYQALDEIGLLTKPVPASPAPPPPQTDGGAPDGGASSDAGASDGGHATSDGGAPPPSDDGGAPPPSDDGGSGPGDDAGASGDDGTGSATGSSSGSSGSHGGASSAGEGDDPDEDAGTPGNFGAGKKKGGCSSTGGGPADGAPVGLALLGLAAIMRRRR